MLTEEQTVLSREGREALFAMKFVIGEARAASERHEVL
jgi:hypothetical protein